MSNIQTNKNYRWFILALSCLTNAIAVAIPAISLSVLLPEISLDLNLNLVQSGLLWGLGSVALIFSCIFAGILIDRYGPKQMIIWGCLLMGLSGSLRGFSPNYSILLVAVFFFGLFMPLISISNIKNAGNWFLGDELGVANGILALGMAFGFFIGSLISATFISPWLGGWRNVFIFYGCLTVTLSIPWYFSRPSTPKAANNPSVSTQESIWQKLRHVLRIKNIWLLGLAIMTINGGVQGLLGYLPTYLRVLGRGDIFADSTTASFHLASMLFVIPITFLSDRMGSRKKILALSASLIAAGIGLLALIHGKMLWIAVILAGLPRDGIMALLFTSTVEIKRVGAAYSGIGTSVLMIFSGIGSLIAPPAGNKLADFAPNVPFLFWSGLSLVGLIFISLIVENGIPTTKRKYNSSTA